MNALLPSSVALVSLTGGIADIMGQGIVATPGVVIDGRMIHSGGVPSRKRVEPWPGHAA